MATRPARDPAPRFGIGEWYGLNIAQLTQPERRELAEHTLLPRAERPAKICPFQSPVGNVPCTKEGGVCSLRQYASTRDASGHISVQPVPGAQGVFRATCPYRFHEQLTVFRWVGETILGTVEPRMAGEIGFLESSSTTDSDGGEDVGRIDMVLAEPPHANGSPLNWTAVEIQAVYFSGTAMAPEFRLMADRTLDSLPFPVGNRRPDYRSSGPKRLMPQLQIKVPTLRRWGKKMAVIVDRAFFDSIGEMDHVSHVSNADIAWFVVGFEERPGERRAELVPLEVRYTTLERSVEGLTGGTPVTLPTFEDRIFSRFV